MTMLKLNRHFTLPAILILLLILTCTTSERNNPLDPNNPDYVGKPVASLRVSDTTIYINDTLELIGSCYFIYNNYLFEIMRSNENTPDYYIWKTGSKSETSESGEKKFVWKESGKFIVQMRVVDKFRQLSEWVSCKITVLAGQPTVTLDSSKLSTTIRDSITIILIIMTKTELSNTISGSILQEKRPL